MIRSALCGVALALALAIPAAAEPAPETTIRVAVASADTFAEGYYAEDVGFFRKSGLHVQLTTLATGGQIATAVAAGAADIGISNTVNLANALAHGAPFTVIAAGAMYSAKNPTTVLVVPAKSPIRTARDLEGKTIAVTALKDLTEIGSRAWMDQNGADSSKTHFVEVPFAQVGAALERGAIDAGLLAEPWLTASKSNPSLRVLANVYDAVSPEFLLSEWFTSNAFAKQHQDVVSRFAAAIYEAARWANGHHAESARILAKYGKTKLETLEQMTRATYATSVDPKLVDPVLALTAKYDQLSRGVTASELGAK
jgi:NitT/TauT family transport system substrate-binding protein